MAWYIFKYLKRRFINPRGRMLQGLEHYIKQHVVKVRNGLQEGFVQSYLYAVENELQATLFFFFFF